MQHLNSQGAQTKIKAYYNVLNITHHIFADMCVCIVGCRGVAQLGGHKKMISQFCQIVKDCYWNVVIDNLRTF